MIDNPYYNLFLEEYSLTSDYVKGWRWRDEMVVKYSWAVPSNNTIASIVDYIKENNLASIVEMGAGNGYWAWLLQQSGVDVFPCDLGLSHKNYNNKHYTIVHKVGVKHLDQIQDHSNFALMLVWPPLTSHKKNCRYIEYEDREKYLKHCPGKVMNLGGASVKRYRGDHVIYVGESREGCTGDDYMFQVLEQNYDLVNDVDIPNFHGMNDRLFFYRRKKS